MVQVDVFWSYGLGASMGLAAGRQLVAQRKPLAENPYFVKTVLFAALLFAPSGMYLLWNFPDWETMQLGDRGLPAWLVVLFAITNVTQAMLGFWVVERLLRAGRRYLAVLQVVGAYLGMFFILVHGWDGLGWRRFLSPDASSFAAWDGDWTAWLTSDVALTLLGMGAILLPVLFTALVRWDRSAPPAVVVGRHLALVFGVALGLALAAHVLLTWLGTGPGIVATVILWTAAAWTGAQRGGVWVTSPA